MLQRYHIKSHQLVRRGAPEQTIGEIHPIFQIGQPITKPATILYFAFQWHAKT